MQVTSPLAVPWDLADARSADVTSCARYVLDIDNADRLWERECACWNPSSLGCPVSLHDHELMIETALAGDALASVWADYARQHGESGG